MLNGIFTTTLVRSVPPFWQHKIGLPIDVRVTMGTLPPSQSPLLPTMLPTTPSMDEVDALLDEIEEEWQRSWHLSPLVSHPLLQTPPLRPTTITPEMK